MENNYVHDPQYKVEVRNLTKYFGDLHVLDDVSFNIKKGEFLCVVGPTGCGKTTFLNLLTRLYEPSSGDLYIDGKSADPKKHNLAFVFQEPSAFPWLTVEKNLEYGLRVKRWPNAKIKERIDKIVSLLGLEQYRHAYPHQLSVSTEQKVVIGRAFAMDPDLLLMDEPSMGIAPLIIRDITDIIKGLHDDGTTILLVEQNAKMALGLADYGYVLDTGTIVIEGKGSDLRRDEKVVKAYLGG